jgi:hypothetical protein
VEVDDALVHAHLVAVPGVGTLRETRGWGRKSVERKGHVRKQQYEGWADGRKG